MTLQASGAISLNQVNVELKLSGTAKISLNDAAVRKLLGKASGVISMSDAYGKSHEIRFVNTTRRSSASIYELMGKPTAAGTYIFENNAEINGHSASYALRTGVFPAGSTLTIINNSYIRGMGGTGSSAVTVSGGAGGDAIYIDMACRIDNTNGYIFAGGGGGGSAHRANNANASYYIMAGGGGGAGSALADGGKNAYALQGTTGAIRTNTAPKAGTATAGGAGGVITESSYAESSIGGAGGANGASGTTGTFDTGTTAYKLNITLGVAGSSGRAIVSNGKAVAQVAGFNTTRVKGAFI